MGCGASTAVSTSSPTRDINNGICFLDDASDDSILREMHAALTKEDTLSLQRLVFPISRDLLTTQVEKKFRATYQLSLSDSAVLKRDPIWGMLLSDNLPRLQIQSIADKGVEDTSSGVEVLDVILSLVNVHENRRVFDEGVMRSLCGTESDLLHLAKVDVQDRPNVIQLRNGRGVDISDIVSYFSGRLHELLSAGDVRGALYIIIMRCEVDLSDIAERYKEMFSETLWNQLTDTYPHIQLLDHTTPKQVSLSGNQTSSRTQERTAIENGAANVSSTNKKDSGDGTNAARREVPSTNPATTPDEGELEVDTGTVPTPPATVDTDADEMVPTTGKKMRTVEDQLEDLHRMLSLEGRSEQTREILAEVVSLHADSNILLLYSETYKQDLLAALEGKLDEDSFKVAEYLLLGYLRASALLLDKAIKENDQSTVDIILMVLLCSSSQQIRDIALVFADLSGDSSTSLHDVLAGNLLGEFQRFVAALLKGDRDDGSETDEGLAKTDALKLHTATDFKWTGEDNVFSEFFIKRNMNQLKLTFQFFTDESGSDITELILQEFAYHLQKALLNLVYIANNGLRKFLAKFVYESKSKSHFSSVLIWTIAARFDVDFKEVSREYKSKYNAHITDLIQGVSASHVTSGLSETSTTLLTNLYHSVAGS